MVRAATNGRGRGGRGRRRGGRGRGAGGTRGGGVAVTRTASSSSEQEQQQAPRGRGRGRGRSRGRGGSRGRGRGATPAALKLSAALGAEAQRIGGVFASVSPDRLVGSAIPTVRLDRMDIVPPSVSPERKTTPRAVPLSRRSTSSLSHNSDRSATAARQGSSGSAGKSAAASTASVSHGPKSLSDLPDDLLLAVLSWLSPLELLGTVALVCSHWKELVDCEEAWRRADVVMDNDNCLRQARLLERAPRVRLLDMSAMLTPDVADRCAHSNGDAIWEAWEMLDMRDSAPPDALDLCVERDGVSNVGLLERYGPGLRRLTARLGTRGSTGREYGQLHLALQEIGKMAKLKHLELYYELYPGTHGGYDKELGRGCPALTSFSFHFPAVVDYKHWQDVVLDVLTHKAGQLTAVALTPSAKCPEVPDAVWTALGRCDRLRHLAVPVPPGLRLLAQFPDLRSLALAPSKHASLTRKALADVDQQADLIAALARLERLELRLQEPDDTKAGNSSGGRPDRMAALLDNLLSDRCVGVRSLSLRGGRFPEEAVRRALAERGLLPRLSGLELVAVAGLRARHLAALAEAAGPRGGLRALRLSAVTVPLEPRLAEVLAALHDRLHLLIDPAPEV